MIADDSVIGRSLDVRVRRIGDRQLVARGSELRELNDVAAVIWKLANGKRSMLEISEGVVAEYDVSLPEAQADVTEFVAEMVEAGFLKVRE